MALHKPASEIANLYATEEDSSYTDALNACDTYLRPCLAIVDRNPEIEAGILAQSELIAWTCPPYELLADYGDADNPEE